MTRISARVVRSIGSLGEIFSMVDAFIAEQRMDAAAEYCIKFVVEELFTNLVKYNLGGAATISLALEWQGDGWQLELLDDNVEPFDPATVAAVPVDAGIHEREPGGLGLHLVRTMVDELSYAYDAGARRMRVEVHKRLE
jgi:anti-sigma regulatory factor (Ser/Thr protein kinase)